MHSTSWYPVEVYQDLKSGHTSSEGSSVGSNCVKSCSSDLRQTLARTLSLPRCGIPMMMLSTPSSLDLSIIIFIAGIKTSQPSMPKRFSELHFLARKASNLDHTVNGKKCTGKTGQVEYQSKVKCAASLNLILVRIESILNNINPTPVCSSFTKCYLPIKVESRIGHKVIASMPMPN